MNFRGPLLMFAGPYECLRALTDTNRPLCMFASHYKRLRLALHALQFRVFPSKRGDRCKLSFCSPLLLLKLAFCTAHPGTSDLACVLSLANDPTSLISAQAKHRWAAGRPASNRPPTGGPTDRPDPFRGPAV